MPDPPDDRRDPPDRGVTRRGRPLGKSGGGTREFLLDTAREVMIERGLGRATMREIADRAGVNPALLHYYLGTKTGLFTAIVERVHEQLRGQLEDVASRAGSASDRLRALCAAYTDVIAAEPYITRLMLEELLDASERSEHFTDGIGELLARHVRQLFEDGTASGEFRRLDLPFPFAEIAPQVVFLLLLAPLSQGGTPAVGRLAPWASQAADLLLHGLHA